MSELDKMSKALIRLKKGPNNRSDLAEIQVTARSISDLAMIYGFQGVESIARKIYTAIRQHSTKVASSPPFLSKIQAALRGIRDVVGMESSNESTMTVETIERETPPQPQTILDNLSEDQRRVVEIENDAKLLFDIKESESLMNFEEGISKGLITRPVFLQKQLPS